MWRFFIILFSSAIVVLLLCGIVCGMLDYTVNGLAEKLHEIMEDEIQLAKGIENGTEQP